MLGPGLSLALVAAGGLAPVVGGAPSPDPSPVVALRFAAACGQPAQVFCSGTRIAPRAVLTAAHCLRDLPLGLLDVVDSADGHDPAASPVAVAGAFTLPEVDLAVVALVAPFAGPTLAAGALPEPAAGATVTVVGYGDDGTGAFGLRRAGTSTVMTADAAEIVTIPGPALACGGDSGGPILFAGAVVGVNSYGDPSCTMTSTTVRTEAHLAFVDADTAMAAALPEGVPAPGEPECGEPPPSDEGWCAAAPARRRPAPRAALVLVGLALAALAGAGCTAKPAGPCPKGKQHGFGPPKDLLLWCADKDGKRHGPYKEWHTSSQLKLEASYEHGVQTGPFVKWHIGGKKELEGQLKGGLKVGKWTEWNDDGSLRRELEYLPDTEVRWTLYHEGTNKKWIEGRHFNHAEDGPFTEYNPAGVVIARGTMRANAKSGDWQYWNDDGTPSAEPRGAYAPGAFSEE